MPKLILIRGLPGSGKSTMAKAMEGFIHIEADMYHVNGNGEYEFHHEHVKSAHDWCQRTCLTFLRNGKDVVVSNTFTQMWEMSPYIKMEDFADCTVEIREAKGDYGNIHNVPEDVIAKMKQRWEKM